MDIGDRIKSLRENRSMTQLELAEKLNINNSVLSRIESNKRQVEDDLLLKIADLFEVSADYLLGRPSKSSGRAYYGGGKDLTDEEREAVENFLAGYRLRKQKEREQRDK